MNRDGIDPCEKSRLIDSLLSEHVMSTVHDVASICLLCNSSVKGDMIHTRQFPSLYRADNIRDFLVAFKDKKILLKRGLLLKERICS